MKEPIFTWNEETGVATCELGGDGMKFIGTATCHADDLDMKSQRTGSELAFKRAEIEALKYYRNILKAQFDALNQLYYSMKHSGNFNDKSYENYMLQRQISLKENDIKEAKEIIIEKKLAIKEMIAGKEALYQQLRKLRNKNKAV
jgi:hypothetical protein